MHLRNTSSTIPDYTRGANVLRDESNAFRERNVLNTRARGNPIKAVRGGSIIFRLD